MWRRNSVLKTFDSTKKEIISFVQRNEKEKRNESDSILFLNKNNTGKWRKCRRISTSCLFNWTSMLDLLVSKKQNPTLHKQQDLKYKHTNIHLFMIIFKKKKNIKQKALIKCFCRFYVVQCMCVGFISHINRIFDVDSSSIQFNFFFVLFLVVTCLFGEICIYSFFLSD